MRILTLLLPVLFSVAVAANDCPSDKYLLQATLIESNDADAILLDMLIDPTLVKVEPSTDPKSSGKTEYLILSIQPDARADANKVAEFRRTMDALKNYGLELEAGKKEDPRIKNTVRLSCLND